jgi:hypothetical protein
MGEFNIHNSKIEQLTDSGNNYKLKGLFRMPRT